MHWYSCHSLSLLEILCLSKYALKLINSLVYILIFRKYSNWADTNTLMLHVSNHIWNMSINFGILYLQIYQYTGRDTQKFSCRVFLGQRCLDYEAMLHHLDIPMLLTHRRYLKITTMFNIHYFPTGVFMRCSILSTRQ